MTEIRNGEGKEKKENEEESRERKGNEEEDKDWGRIMQKIERVLRGYYEEKCYGKVRKNVKEI